MPVTPINNLPYPALTDPPNGAVQIQALAQAIDGKLPTAKVLYGVATVVFNASGNGTVTTGAGWVPSLIILTAETSSNVVIAVAVRRGAGFEPGANTFNITANKVSDGSVFVGNMTIGWVIRD